MTQIPVTDVGQQTPLMGYKLHMPVEPNIILPVHVLFLRHGQHKDTNSRGIHTYNGISRARLTAEGRRQIEIAACYVSDNLYPLYGHVEAVVSSYVPRALQSSRIIASRLNAPLIPAAELNEFYTNGEAKVPLKELEPFDLNPMEHPAYNGETPAQIYGRTDKFLNGLYWNGLTTPTLAPQSFNGLRKEDLGHAFAIVVTHGGNLQAIQYWHLSRDPTVEHTLPPFDKWAFRKSDPTLPYVSRGNGLLVNVEPYGTFSLLRLDDMQPKTRLL